jgi:hypothetical protein
MAHSRHSKGVAFQERSSCSTLAQHPLAGGGLSKSKVSTRCHTTLLLLLRPYGVLLHSAHQLISVKLRLPNEQTAKIPKRSSRLSQTPLSQSPKFQLGTETTSLGTPLPPILTQSVLFDVGFDQLRDIIYVIGNREILIKSVCM